MQNRREFFERWTNYRPQYPTVVSRPRIIGYYSVDEHKNYVPDSSKLKYFNPPKYDFVSFDLDNGRDIPVPKLDPSIEGTTTRWSGILKWIELNREKIKAPPGSDRLLEANFVTTPASLTHFMTAPFSHDNWKVWAGKYKGTIYLRNDNCYSHERSENDKKFGFWGHKFEQYVVSDSPDESPDATKPGVEHGEFRCVYKHQFSNYSVLYSAVKKAVISKKVLQDPLPLDKLKFMELKTNKLIQHAGHENTLKRHKFLVWYANAFLTHDDKVLCGFRDENGLVRKLSTYQIEYMVGASRRLWNPVECVQSCEQLLSIIAHNVVEDCDETIYELTKKPNEDFSIKKWRSSERNCPVQEWYRNAMTQ